MKQINIVVLNFTVAILDFLYQGRDYPRFWVLETIARAPYFAFLSVLHFRESLGLRGPEHIYLMKEHFYQSINETEHLEYMESRNGNRYWIDRFVAKHLVLIYYWINVVYYLILPRYAYHLSYEVEVHASLTYAKYLSTHGGGDDFDKITEIMNDEVQHFQELKDAMEMLAIS